MVVRGPGYKPPGTRMRQALNALLLAAVERAEAEVSGGKALEEVLPAVREVQGMLQQIKAGYTPAKLLKYPPLARRKGMPGAGGGT